MSETTEPSAGAKATDLAGTLVDHWDAFASRLAAGFRGRLANLGGIPHDAEAFSAGLMSAGWTFPAFVIALAAVAASTFGVFVATRRVSYSGKGVGTGLGFTFLAALVALAAGALLGYGLSDGEPNTRRALLLIALAAVLSGLVLAILDAVLRDDGAGGRSLRRFRVMTGAALVYALFGIAAFNVLRVFAAGPGLRDAFGTLGVVIPVLALLIAAYAGSRRQVERALAGPEPRTSRRALLARSWPVLAPALIVATLILAQIAATAGQPLRPIAVLVTIALILLGPHLDALIKARASAGAASPSVPLAIAAGVRTARLALLAVGGALLTAVWGAPVALALGADLTALAWPALETAGIILVSAYLWNIVGIAVERALATERVTQNQPEVDENSPAPSSRLGSVLPLIAGAAKAGLAALAMLTVLLTLGVNVWPLVTGLSVFGLAIGFGSQTLVKDVVSGLFFLADDAFRQGEYIETSGAKGTVEKISIRSLSLRHPRGALATIPYGQIGKIQNYSRDWVIEKIAFRVAFNTDVELVRKLFKKIGQSLAADPALAPDLLEPFKSQGIAAVEDGTLVVRGKFKARAGKQFQIKKRVLAAVQQAFHENGIVAVAKPMVFPGPGG
jgi:moderate conductance mechanosensitive channel